MKRYKLETILCSLLTCISVFCLTACGYKSVEPKDIPWKQLNSTLIPFEDPCDWVKANQGYVDWGKCILTNKCVDLMQGHINNTPDIYHDEEIQLGQQVMDELSRQYNVTKAGSRLQYIANRVVNALPKKGQKPRFDYEFYEISQNYGTFFNALAVPGGNILIGDGILELTEAEIAYIIGHEIAHIQKRSMDAQIGLLLSNNDGFIASMKKIGYFFLDYCTGPRNEAVMDWFGAEYAVAACYEPTAIVRAIKRFEADESPADKIFTLSMSHPPGTMRGRWGYQAANWAHNEFWKDCPYYIIGKEDAWFPYLKTPDEAIAYFKFALE